VLSPSRQQLRHHLAVRAALVQSRSQYVTTVRGIARAHGIKLPKSETRTFTAKILTCSLDATVHKLLAPLLATIDTIDAQLVGVELALEERCLSEPAIVRLATSPGVSKIVSATFVSVIDEASRFRNAHQVEAYLGLVPSESTTGGRRRLGSITKQGNLYARVALMEAAWCIYRSRGNDPLKLWARAVGRRRGNKIAVTALARRLAGVLWAMWRDGTVYEPVRVAVASATGLRGAAQSTELQAEALERAARKLKRLAKQADQSVRRRRALTKVAATS
jgi:transposase